jgi:hypothetical protein
MHPEAWEWITRNLRAYSNLELDVLEFGSLNINGSTRALFPNARYYGIDLQTGPGVDEVADATSWQHPTLYGKFDVVVCSEVFEHLCDWRLIVKNAAAHLNDTGVFISTCASDGRHAHSAKGIGAPLARWQSDHPGHPLDEVEWYQNVGYQDLELALKDAGFTLYRIEQRTSPGDIYCAATRGRELPILL